MPFTVGQLAKRTGLTVRALHHYHAIGLLVPSHRSESGYRLYTRADVARLFQIQALQRLGLSLTEIDAVLENGGAALPDMIAQQIEELSERIDHATTLRSRLVQLRSMLAQGEQPVANDWLAVVELITAYDGYCSPEELTRLLAHARAQPPADDLPALIAEIRDAMARHVAPESDEAQTLSVRWKQIVMSRIGGDITLGIKMKLAYFENPDLKARFETRTGYDASVQEYMTRIWRHAHVAAWTRHLGADDAQRLDISDERMRDWLFVVADMRSAVGDGVAADSEPVQRVLERWDVLLDRITVDDRELKKRVLQALATDAELQSSWALDAAVMDFVNRARGSRRPEGVPIA